ncbi:hypothetical protein [uncultured Nostoc sp.]|uniref:hypothetical protein n=1 Tax=uncultured Nostoc sp. TaxID=340711 RepID=UPI0035CCA604
MKKVIVTLISLATLGLGFAVSLPAGAAQPINQTKRVAIESHRRHEEYRVQYHRHHEKRWINAGTFRNRALAQRDVRKLEHRGYQARIVDL